MKVHEERFLRIYGAHFILIRRKDVKDGLTQVSLCLKTEEAAMGAG
jgi:hypothetical protein